MFPTGKFKVKFNITASPVYYTQPSTPQSLLDGVNFKGDYYKITKIEIVLFNQIPNITNVKIINEKNREKLFKNFYLSGNYEFEKVMNHKTKSYHPPKLNIVTSQLTYYTCIVYYTAYYEIIQMKKFLEVEENEFKNLKINQSWPKVPKLSNYEKLKKRLSERNNNVIIDTSYNCKYYEIPQVYANAPVPPNLGSKMASVIKDLGNDVKNLRKTKVEEHLQVNDKGIVLPSNDANMPLGKETVEPHGEVSSIQKIGKNANKNKRKRIKAKEKREEKLKAEKAFDEVYSKLEVVAKKTVPQMNNLFTGQVSKRMFLTESIKILDELGYVDDQIDQQLFAFINEWNLRNPTIKFPNKFL
jgi:hypothetical protein